MDKLRDDLLLALLDGVFEEPAWTSFLDKLRSLTAADYASLIFRPPGMAPNTALHLYSGRRSPPVIQELYKSDFQARDPTPYHGMVDGQVYSLGELLQRGEPSHDTFVREIMMPSGMNALRMVRTVEASGITVWLTVTRREGDFSHRDTALLAALVPFLRAVLRTFIALERERVNGVLAGEIIRRLNCGWIVLDATGKVLEADPCGRDFLLNSEVLRQSPQGTLQAARRECSEQIEAAVRELSSVPGARARCVILNREPWWDMLLVPADSAAHSVKSLPAVIAYVQRGDVWQTDDAALAGEQLDESAAQLGRLFGLAANEARLALALARGLTLAEAAQALQLTLETTRTYSKRVFAKVGARGQADLVRIINRSLVRIA